jgi:hypothetical protein
MENGGMAMRRLLFIPQGHKFRTSRQAAQLSFILAILLLGWGTGPSLSTNYAFAALQEATFVVA